MIDSKADHMRSLYNNYVRHPKQNWKMGAEALVPKDMANKVAEAMDFVGSIVDERKVSSNGMVILRSDGYYAHGF